MKAVEASVLSFLRKQDQFHIPIYQRTYSWTKKECVQLWDDIIRAGERDNIPFHFIGSIVYVEKGLSQVSKRAPLLVIDGQQRMTTIAILLAALADALGDSEPIDGFSEKRLFGYYLRNDLETGDRRHKLILTETDRDTLTSIIEKRPLPPNHSVRVSENHKLFKYLIGRQKDDLATVCKGIAKLVIVDIALDRDQDNPQLIFESLNSTGRVLTQADLIRNFVLMGLEPDLQDRVYRQHWHPMELAFGQENYNEHFDRFVRHYLTLKTGAIPRIGDVYEAFKDFRLRSDADVVTLVTDLQNFSTHYCAMALGAEKDPGLREAFNDLRELKSDVTYPLLLELYQDYASGTLERDDFLHAVRLVESYLFRRTICGMASNTHGEIFRVFGNALKKERYLESLKAHFLGFRSHWGFPGDAEFKRDLKHRDLYNIRTRNYLLRKLENHGRKETVQVLSYTIEHIMPQNEDLPQEWRKSLGEDWENIHRTYLHTLGNLTLTAHNSEYSDHPFPWKRDMPNGFKTSPLYLNEGLGSVETWNESAIGERAEKLARRACEVWPVPALPPDVLAAYRPTSTKKDQLSLSDFPFLARPPVWSLFEKLQSEVLSLDPCVFRDIKKSHIAYRVESSFVSVTPRSWHLVLILNMGFPDVSDPRGICWPNTSSPGAGDVGIEFRDLADLDYVMGLVRQAFEQQFKGDKDG